MAWIGGLLGQICKFQGIKYTYGSDRVESGHTLKANVVAVKPTHVFNAAGRPNCHTRWVCVQTSKSSTN
ncbi:putative dTDP-4-dehydrorhamnose reductase [Helianthus annuus]|uniref:dTDP-4-dehydrorhamnose reductase n=1 Tax=Helianthus annuus TaxID=4232 RepID=A0A9K3IWY3_HELAN|nr:putative dTDP-4-dehydrorhamnose reductase [Helianthus annuus]KAJ0561435.1 putative dTDP-4-dehydrorhamnose reductase [Helianthus annuus]KAJ0568085.1 putative dTDP-4-dehydrorhamnose reductase [Helianthus annuus]KAJ0574498.1 putative dTDP-4-dehydrorhamnose reductase [Helianthus annuus]KAJ0738828.1 putative dTDP-4-dehydrorhamnose reductase [Helianthus annuus]